LVPLLSSVAGVDQLLPQSQPRPAFDLWTPLMSMPGIFRHGANAFPAPIPYLKADPDRVNRWRSRLAGVEGFKIGIVWQGNKARRNDHKRSFALELFAPLAALAGVQLISLQKETPLDADVGFPVTTLGDDLDSSGAFLDTAAVMTMLDLVISADTSIAHLAGALGVKVWVALAAVPDWRWTMQGERTPWYPTMRLFRQPVMGDWTSVFEHMQREAALLLRYNEATSGK
jgi:hypothetical protein